MGPGAADPRRLGDAGHVPDIQSIRCRNLGRSASGDKSAPVCAWHYQMHVIARAHNAPEAVGCGGWRLLTPHTAEIKRMYVAASARGRGLGRRILRFLEDQAAAHGVIQLVLETGVRNDAALTLYRSSGYLPRPPYVPERDTRVNRAMTKALSHPRFGQP